MKSTYLSQLHAHFGLANQQTHTFSKLLLRFRFEMAENGPSYSSFLSDEQQKCVDVDLDGHNLAILCQVRINNITFLTSIPRTLIALLRWYFYVHVYAC